MSAELERLRERLARIVSRRLLTEADRQLVARYHDLLRQEHQRRAETQCRERVA